VRLAEYLGVPVDRALDGIYIRLEAAAEFGDKITSGFMFDIYMPGQWTCELRAISFSVSQRGRLSIFSRDGSFIGKPQLRADDWLEICSHNTAVGYNRIEIPTSTKVRLMPCETQALYLHFSGSHLNVGSTNPTYEYNSMSTEMTLSAGMKLVCLRGRAAGTEMFSAGPHNDDRFFVGGIEYSLV